MNTVRTFGCAARPSGAGLLFFLGLVIALPHLQPRVSRRVFVAAGLTHALGIVFVGLVPGSPSNAASGIMAIHVAGAVAAIGGGNLAAIMSFPTLAERYPSRAVAAVGPVLGTLGLVSAIMLTTHLFLPDGVWERGAVYTFFAWQFLTGIVLLCSPHPTPRTGVPGTHSRTG